MEYLSIQNFLTIKSAELEVKKINILIGEQSTGKSIIAKVLYFFKNILSSTLIKAAVTTQEQSEVKKQIIDNFEELFPRYTWEKQNFKIFYRFNDFELGIEYKKNELKNFKLEFNYNQNIEFIYTNSTHRVELIKKEIEKNFKKILNQIVWDDDQEKLYNIVFKQFYDVIGNEFLEGAFFIPASRSFFAILEKNIFSFLANEIKIVPLIKTFGKYYNLTKDPYRILTDDSSSGEVFSDEIKNKAFDKINKLVQKIISGKYVYENEKDFIYVSKDKKINLINASSGQQEVLPMLLFICTMPVLINGILPNIKSIRFFIEEPEAHLFPFAQKDILEIFALLYNNMNCRFFITTHSPYILTIFNNLIMAENVKQEIGQEIEGFENTVKYEDVAAYTIKDGKIESILDEEVKLIGTSILDSVSDVLNEEFDHLIDKQLNS